MQPLDFVHAIVLQLSMVVMWLTFAIFNLALISIALLCFWLFSISPNQLFAWVAQLYHSMHLGVFASAFALAGASLATLVYWYVRAWRKIYSLIVTPYLFKEVDAARDLRERTCAL